MTTTHIESGGDRVLTRRACSAALFLGAVTTSAGMLTAQGTGRPWPLMGQVMVEGPFWLLWSALAPVVIRAVRLVPLRAPWTPSRLALHALMAAAVVAMHTLALFLMQRALGMALGSTFGAGLLVVTRWRLASDVLAYGGLIGMIVASDAARRALDRDRAATQLSADLARAQLEALRLQLNPHFLFNALNTVAMLVRQQRDDQSIRMLSGLGDLLRRTLAHKEPEVSLRVELDVLDQYLAIERVRFGDRLRVDRAIDASVLDAAVPSFILQPLVENAIRHGIEPQSAPGHLLISARRHENVLVLEVHNDGRVGDERSLTALGNGLGIRNTVERLACLYGDAFAFALDPTERGAVATVTVPFRLPTRAA